MPNQVAYGFVSLQDVFGQRVAQVGVETIRTAITDSVRAYNEEIRSLVETWASIGITTRERVELPGSGTMQPLDEWGIPLPVRPSGAYDSGYPIYGGGTAWGTNRVSAALLTVEEANRYTSDAFQRDATWVRTRLMGAIFDNVTWQYTDQQLGVVDVMPLANSDGVIYQRMGAAVSIADNHYMAQLAPISNAANPFPAIHSALEEHPSNSGPYVVYVSSNLTGAIEDLAAFTQVDDPDLLVANTRDRLANAGNDAIRGPGSMILGKVNKLWVVEWRSLPDNYMVAVAMGAAPFIRMREYDAAGLKGLFPEFHSPDGNLIENRFVRYAGFGIRNRVAAVAYQVGSATYQVPPVLNVPHG